MSADQIGPQVDDNGIRGWLTFQWLPDELQRAEDSTLAADHERARQRFGRAFTREATDAERELLTHLGHEMPDELTTRVAWPASGVRNRRWPQLEGETP